MCVGTEPASCRLPLTAPPSCALVATPHFDWKSIHNSFSNFPISALFAGLRLYSHVSHRLLPVVVCLYSSLFPFLAPRISIDNGHGEQLCVQYPLSYTKSGQVWPLRSRPVAKIRGISSPPRQRCLLAHDKQCSVKFVWVPVSAACLRQAVGKEKGGRNIFGVLCMLTSDKPWFAAHIAATVPQKSSKVPLHIFRPWQAAWVSW